MITLLADVETDGFLEEMTRVWCLVIEDMEGTQVSYADQPGYEPLTKGYERLRAADRVVFHNGVKFDMGAINKVAPGTIRLEQIWDTLLMARLYNPDLRGHSLQAWGERLGVGSKGDWDDFTKFDPAMVEYCEQDVRIMSALYRKLIERFDVWQCPEAITLEHRVQYLIHLQETNGFLLNVKEAEKLVVELRGEQAEIAERLQSVFPPRWVPVRAKGTAIVKAKRNHSRLGYVADTERSVVALEVFNPASNQQVESRLRALGWKPTKYTPSGQAQLDESVLADLAIMFDEAKELARYLRLNKQLGQIADGDNAWLRFVKPTGRVHGYVNTNGAVTGRMSHSKPNMAQVDKKDLRMRAVWLPRPGWKLVGVDADGIEERMLAHYLAKNDGGAYIDAVTKGSKDDGTDPHTLAQRLLSFHERDNVKREKYAYFYGAGNLKLGLIAIDDARSVDKWTAEGSPHLFSNGKPIAPAKIGKANRGKLEAGIEGLETLVSTVKRMHRERGWVPGLDGRRIRTRSEHASLNTLLQGSGGIVMKMALVLFHYECAADIPRDAFGYCANVHDEVQIEADPCVAEEIGQRFCEAITLAGERLGVRCPLSGSAAVGDNWKETH